MFWYHRNLVTNRKKMVHGSEGTERCPVFIGPRFGPFCVLLFD